MEDYYNRDDQGKWLSFKEPPVDFKNPPACPTCRRAITSPRYGRVTKRAALDILENNVASSMSRSLQAMQEKVSSLPREVLELQIREKTSQISVTSVNTSIKEMKQRQKKRSATLKETRFVPVPFDAINPSISEFHGIPSGEASAWKKIVQILLTSYSDAYRVAATRSAHKHAWEASFAYLFNEEMKISAEDPRRAPREPQEHAMRMAKLRVGQPRPRADQRFIIEAFCMTISIRLTLAELAQTWLESCRTRKSTYPTENRRMWGAYIVFLYESSREDGRIALRLAADSESHRLKPKVAIRLMRIDLEQFQFNVQMTKQSGQFSSDKRMGLARGAEEKESEARLFKAEVLREGRSRLSPDFSTTADAILEDWKSLIRSIRQDTFYQPVSREELSDIVKAFGFSEYSL